MLQCVFDWIGCLAFVIVFRLSYALCVMSVVLLSRMSICITAWAVEFVAADVLRHSGVDCMFGELSEDAERLGWETICFVFVHLFLPNLSLSDALATGADYIAHSLVIIITLSCYFHYSWAARNAPVGPHLHGTKPIFWLPSWSVVSIRVW